MGRTTPYQIQKVSRDKSITRNRSFVKNYLSKKSCIDCGNSDIRVLEFDHVRGNKLYEVSYMITKSYRLSKIEEEISKCDIRCANCHRIITQERRLKTNLNLIK